MKNIIIIILTILIGFRSNSQVNPAIITGTWKYQNGSEVFIVNIWKNTDAYTGHYKKILVDANGNQISEIYNSNKPYKGSSTEGLPYTIRLGFISPDYSVRALLLDNTFTSFIYRGEYVRGDLAITILNPECFNAGTNCPLQAKWLVTIPKGLRNPDTPDFSVPTDIILIKQ